MEDGARNGMSGVPECKGRYFFPILDALRGTVGREICMKKHGCFSDQIYNGTQRNYYGGRVDATMHRTAQGEDHRRGQEATNDTTRLVTPKGSADLREFV